MKIMGLAWSRLSSSAAFFGFLALASLAIVKMPGWRTAGSSRATSGGTMVGGKSLQICNDGRRRVGTGG